MRLARTSTWIALLCAISLSSVKLPAQATAAPAESNLLSWGAGALVVQSPPSESTTGQWSVDALLDEDKDTGWANKRGDLAPKVLVFELAQRSEISSLAFDTKQVYSHDRSAKDVTVDISDSQDGGFINIAKISLAAMQDGQKFPLRTPASGRYIKLTVLNNYGDSQFMEIMNIYAYGKPLGKRPLPDNSGTFSSDYGDFHMLQTGITVAGCYMRGEGLIENGGFDGRVLRATWSSRSGSAGPRDTGSAIIIFPDDGKSFVGHFWHAGETNSHDWNGTRISKDVGSCPHWKPGGNNVVQQLQSEGRARLYGILFDTDSDHLKPESKPTLDALIAAASTQPTWSFGIEGYTDNVGGDPHNQTLSEKRAASVKAYLVAAGVNPSRLTSQGFGATHPVSSNDTELGRSQNRRVEIVKK